MRTTIEHLTKPRFEVIADYPKSKLEIGSVLSRVEHATNDWYDVGDQQPDLGIIQKHELIKYPHLFRPLQWWEKRSKDEMPKYLKQTGYVDTFVLPVPDVYIQITEHFKHHSGDWRNNSFDVFTSSELSGKSSSYSGWEPCSEEEYLANKK